ncbi:THO complex subunit 7 [Araneus ventricosus]|uniref:THO complex subunit 7 n=1 Tax=Araneus ventricosus TaxID=182803 RepID=A0A4Y2AIU8_ARAVE|nr:THO complex subunit 7 [Araneus ventricosus]
MSDSEAGASHISDEEVFRRKLMMDGEGMGDDRKIDTLFSSFIQWCDAQGQRGEEIADGYERLLAQLDHLKFSSQMSAERHRASAREIEELDEILTNMEKEVAEEKKVIAERHLELKEAKKARLNKMKYDALGRIISSLPDRKNSMKQLERIEGDIKTLKLQKEALQKQSDEREKHLRLLLTATHELKYKFRKELEDWEDAVSD